MKPLKRYDIFCIVLLFTLTFILFFSNAKAEISDGQDFSEVLNRNTNLYAFDKYGIMGQILDPITEKENPHKYYAKNDNFSNIDYITQNSKGAISSGFFAQASNKDPDSLTDDSSQLSKASDNEVQDMKALGDALANPLSYLWLLFFQNDTYHYGGDILDGLGEDAKYQNITLFNPVLSIQLTEKWKTIFRPVIPINSFDTVDNVNLSASNVGEITGVDFDRETGLGDIVLWTAFSRQYKPPFVWAFGPTIMLNTATDDLLGTGKNSAGPMGLAFYISDKWIIGAIGQHWWSFSGSDKVTVSTSQGNVRVERPDVNLTDLQVVLRYRVTPTTNIGTAPNWRYNHETDELDLPIGGGFDTLIMIGKLPVKIGLEVYYFVDNNEDFGPEWQIRLLFVPIIPSPGWSRIPIFK